MIDPTDYKCYIDSIKIEPTGKKCIGPDKCDNDKCPLAQGRDERECNE